jgi:AcrR family transcriptional regulator
VTGASFVDRFDLAARHASAVRASIIDAASRAFAAKGYIGGTINEVCAIAGITPKTFYRYFSSKHELFLEVGESLVGKWLSIKKPRLLSEPDPVKRHLMKISGYLSLSSILPDLLIFLKAQAQSGDESAHRILVSIYDALAGTFIDDFRELRSGTDGPRHDEEMSALRTRWGPSA